MTAIRRPRRRWRDLPREHRRAVLTMLWLVSVMHVAVRVWDYRRVRAFVERRRPEQVDAPQQFPNAWRLATSRVQAYSWLPGNCLSRSLALYACLRQRGWHPILRLGVSLDGRVFSAHAWVQLDEVVVNDRPDVAERYRPLDSPASSLVSSDPG
jgi:hypothetical protein